MALNSSSICVAFCWRNNEGKLGVFSFCTAFPNRRRLQKKGLNKCYEFQGNVLIVPEQFQV